MKSHSVIVLLVLTLGSSAFALAEEAADAANDSTRAGIERVAGIGEHGPQASVRRASTGRLDLDTTVITGNRELPKVLYIVPWKRAELGELPAQPFNTLLDEVLEPVDRDVFRREVRYHAAVAGGRQETDTD